MAVELSKEERTEVLESVKRYFEEMVGEQIDDLKATLLLDFILTEIGPFAYNKGVSDAERYFREKTEDLSGSCYEHPLTYWAERDG